MKILKLLEWVFVALVLGLVLLTASSALPTKKLFSSYVVATGSMEPTIPVGAVVLTRFADPASLQENDVITYEQPNDPNTIIVHRIIRKTSDGSLGFTTKGDNNDTEDTWLVTPNNVLGKMFFVIPYLGHPISFLKTPAGFAIGIGIPALLLALLQVVKIFQGINEEVEKRTQAALAKHGVSAGEKLSMLLFFILGSLIVSSQTAHALFSATASISGINIQTAALPTEPSPTDPLLFFYPYEGKEEVGFSLTNIASYSKIQYEITYEREGGIQEQLSGEEDHEEGINQFVSQKLFLGTCSGEVCAPHTGIEEVFLTVTLIDEEGNEKVLQSSLRLDQEKPVLELPEACHILTGQIKIVLEGKLSNNSLIGTDESELILGGSGNDHIEGKGGNDCIITGPGNHSVQGGAGDDIIVAGNGSDSISGGSGNDTIYAGGGSNSVSGNEGNDKIIGGSGYDVLNGNEGDDYLDGQQGINVLDGGADTDTCHNGTVKNNCEVL